MNTVRKALISAGLVGSTLVGGALGAALLNGTANAAESSTSTAATAGSSSTAPSTPDAAPAGDQNGNGPRGHGGPGGPHMANGITEAVLTGDTADKVKAAALAAVPGAAVDRAETDAEGSPYEAHMTKADGSHVTVKVDSSFSVTGVEAN